MADSHTLLNHDMLREMRESDGADYVVELIDGFFALTDRHLPLIRQARLEGDWQRLGIFVHPIKSSAGFVGVGSLSELAGRIAALAARDEFEELNELTERMEGLLSRARVELARERIRLTS